MPGRKREESYEPFDYAEAQAQLVQAMSSVHLSRVNEMPHIELYRDQLLMLVSTELAPLYSDGEKIITGSMVNNYVKQRVIPAPTRKRYTTRHLAFLLIVCTLKRVLSIAQIAQLIELCREQDVDFGAAYDEFAGYLERGLRQRFAQSEDIPNSERPLPVITNREGTIIEGTLPALLQTAINLVIDKVYLERNLELQNRRMHARAHSHAEPVHETS